MSIAIVEMVATNNSNFSAHGPTYQWNEHQRNDILGCFFWGFLLSAIPGGRLSEIYGTKIILGTAMLISSVLTIVTPLACHLHYYCVVAVRVVLGLALGVSWPSIPPLALNWVAPADTSKFMAHTIACALGAGLTLPVSGYIIALLMWPSVFYITGAISLVWTAFWFYLVYDSPEKHPRISSEEKATVTRETVGLRHSKGEKETPWIKILLSGPVWAIVVADFCLQFNTNIILNELPSYMDRVLHFNIKKNGLLSSLPYFATYLMAVVFCYIADRWRKSNKFSIVTIRKLFTSISFCIPAVLFLIQIYWGYDEVVSVIVFTLSQGFLAASTAGFISNSMDISPVYSGTIFGLAFTCGASTGYFSSKLVAVVTSEEVSFQQWRYIFWILIALDVVGCLFYYIFGSGDIQKWNSVEQNETETRELNRK
ncbi:hypothetical protein Zmor_015227 [Zophobas morio]|uniref:Major facilitator superfamily (MFS) profile domain-containing protein n=2 Tax=Zophobas morio TaxID=2755281 RepID=A0AA38IM39_9CUCU|nr:hypothetical protein Zmor_015227 [Zophobas morio]